MLVEEFDLTGIFNLDIQTGFGSDLLSGSGAATPIGTINLGGKNK